MRLGDVSVEGDASAVWTETESVRYSNDVSAADSAFGGSEAENSNSIDLVGRGLVVTDGAVSGDCHVCM